MASRIAHSRAGLALVLALFAALWAGQAAARPKPDVRQMPMNRFVDWEETLGRPTTFKGGGLNIVLSGKDVRPGNSDYAADRAPVLTVRAPNGKSITLTGVEGYENARAMIGIARIDPATPYPQVVFVTSTFGANCCYWIWALDYVRGEWRALSFGRFHSTVFERFPVDEDGDGRREFVVDDQRYYNAYCPPMCTWAPPSILHLQDGRLVDVSHDRRYRRVFEQDMMHAKEYCDTEGGSSLGTCAGFVASAIRAGRFKWAWDIMLRNYDRSRTAWEGINVVACRKYRPDWMCADGPGYAFADFPSALRWYLGETGYLRPEPIPRRPSDVERFVEATRPAAVR